MKHTLSVLLAARGALAAAAETRLEITTFAGTGEKGFSGDGGPAKAP